MRGWAAYLLALLLALTGAQALAVVRAEAAPVAHHDAGSQLRAPDPHRLSVPVRGCLSTLAAGEGLADLLRADRRWLCQSDGKILTADRVAVRFRVDPAQPPVVFGTRPTLFEGLTLAVVSGGKIAAQSRFVDDELVAAHNGRLVLVPLPQVEEGAAADYVIAVFERPSTRGLIADARVFARDPTVGHEAMMNLLLAAIVCGMLVMPLAFNAAYYRVLREKFVLWHLVVTCGLLTQCLLTSGILSHFVEIPVPVFSRLINVSFAMSVASAAAFCAAFIEPHKLHPRLRTGLYIAAAQVLALSLIDIALPNVFGPLQAVFFYLAYLPILFLFIAVMIDATRRGSRAAKYQIIGWTPFLLVGCIRIVTMVMPVMTPNEAMSLFYLAMVVESVATLLGVADRFMLIRRQRDRAVSRASSLEALSERDDLTGLYNRRALDGALGDFHAQGFTGFALLDLDNFKRVNDNHGHAVGDAVLRTAATVLADHPDAVALRLGGEEFLLLLRGDNVAERVERLREAIPVRIARKVTQLEALVTASAGLIEVEAERTIGNDFVALYRAADDLLYEAKHNGRNLLAARRLGAGHSASGGGRVAAIG